MFFISIKKRLKAKLIRFLISSGLFLIIITSLFFFFKSYKNEIDLVNKDTLTNEIRNINKFIPLEVELSHTLTLSDNFSDYDIFKKSQEITFHANCSYSIDLSSIDKSDIKIDNQNNSIEITIPPLEIFSIEVNEDKTEFSKTETGFFRFGELEMSSEEFLIILDNVKEYFAIQMENDELHSVAIENAKVSFEELIFDSTNHNYNVLLNIQ